VKAFCYKSAKTTIRCQTVLTAFLAFARYRPDLFFGFGHFNGPIQRRTQIQKNRSHDCRQSVFVSYIEYVIVVVFLALFCALIQNEKNQQKSPQQKEKNSSDTHQVIHQVLPPLFVSFTLITQVNNFQCVCLRRLKLFKGF